MSATLKDELAITDDLTIEQKIDALHNMTVELIESHRKLLELVGAIKDQVEPTLDALGNSPMLRMMFGGK